MCRAYENIIQADSDKINNEVFNVSYENKKIIELADLVKKNVENFYNIRDIEIEVNTETNDKRSYHVNSEKITRVLDFRPKFSIDEQNFSCLFQKKLLLFNGWY